MQYECDALDQTWFRIETAAEAANESKLMQHAVEKHFRQAYDQAVKCYRPPASSSYIEQNIGLKDHIRRVMPRFMTLRTAAGQGLVTAMLPPEGQTEHSFRPVIVGPNNADPYSDHADAIRRLAQHTGLALDPARCFPYRRN